MSKLGKVLLFSIVFEVTFAALYFGHVADLALSQLGSPQSSSISGASFGNSGFGQIVDLIFANPIALGIIWSVFNAVLVFRITLRSKSRYA
jgi:hypothetical protein